MPFNLSQDLVPPRTRPTTPFRTPERSRPSDEPRVRSHRWSVVLEHVGHSLATVAMLTGGAPLPLSRGYATRTKDER